MSSAVAVDVSTHCSSRSSNSIQPAPVEGESNHAGLLRRPLCLVTSTLGEAALLQQFIHLTRVRGDDWIQIPVGSLAERFDQPASTIRGGLSRLEESGFLSSRHRPGRAKSYHLERDAVLEALRDRGIEMTEEALMGEGELDYTCRGPSNDQTSPAVPLSHPFCCITPDLLDAALLQQLVYLTNRRGEGEWVQVDATYLSRPFDVAAQTVRNHLDQLEGEGFVSSRQFQSGSAKAYRLEHDSILAVIRRADIETEDDDTSQPPREIQREGARDTGTGGARSSNGGARDTETHQETYNQRGKKERSESVADVEHTCSGKGTRAPQTSPPASQQNFESSRVDQTATDLEHTVLQQLAPWSVSLEGVQHVIRTLRDFGLLDRDIHQYVSERRTDFLTRENVPERREVIRYLVSRNDVIDRGYTQPLETVYEWEKRRTQQEEADDGVDTAVASEQGSPSSGEEDVSDEKPVLVPEDQPDEMEELFNRCRERLSDTVVDEHIEGVLLFDQIEEDIVRFETHDPCRCFEVQRKYLDELEEAARDVWSDIEGVDIFCEGEPLAEWSIS